MATELWLGMRVQLVFHLGIYLRLCYSLGFQYRIQTNQTMRARLTRNQPDIQYTESPSLTAQPLLFVGCPPSHFDLSISRLCKLRCSTSSYPSRQCLSNSEMYSKNSPTGSLPSEASTSSPPISRSPFPLLHLSNFSMLLLPFLSLSSQHTPCLRPCPRPFPAISLLSFQ